MFKFLKEKLKSAISKISESVGKEGEIEEKIVEVFLQELKKSLLARKKSKKQID